MLSIASSNEGLVDASTDDKISINVDDDEQRVAFEVTRAFAKSGRVFQRAGFLVEPRLDPARRLPGLLRTTDELRMVPIMKAARARSLAAELCRFRRDKKSINPPDWLASAILSLPDWPGIPVVESVAENPTLRSDGTIHDTPGYDSSGNYFAPDGVTFPPIPTEPTHADARAALEALYDPLHDFPFVKPCDKSVAIAIMLTQLARPAIAGPTPPFVIRTPTPRTGKDLLTDVLTLVGTGRPTPGRNLPVGDDAELRKVLLSIGISGVRVVSFGNCEGTIGSPTLSHALTREVISDRLLGANVDVTVPLRPVFLFNGNNPRFKSDFAARVVLCNMDAQVADPQMRSNWKYDPLLFHVRQARPSLVAAGLTILRAYVVAGKPKHGRAKKGSFEAWDDLVRGALLWVGAADPLGNDSFVRSDDDQDVEQLRALLVAWRNAFGVRAVTLADAVDASRMLMMSGSGAVPALSDTAKKDLIAALSAFDPKLGDKFTAATLRYHFRHNRGRRIDVVGDQAPTSIMRFEIADSRAGTAKVAAWQVMDDAPPTPPMPPGFVPSIEPEAPSLF